MRNDSLTTPMYRNAATGGVAPQRPDAPASARPLCIALLSYRSAPFSGGQGIWVRHLSRALVAAGHEVDVYSGQPYPHLDPGVGLVRVPGLNLYGTEKRVRALRPRHLKSFTDTFEWASVVSGGFPEPYTFGRRVTKLLAARAGDYDVVHDNQSLSPALHELERLGLPVLTTIHHPITKDRDLAVASETQWGMRLLIRRWHLFLAMQRRVASRLPLVHVVSESTRRDIADAFGVDAKRTRVVYNGIDTETFRPLPDVPRHPRRIMATASADVPLKGLTFLLEAYAELGRRYPDAELVVLGTLRKKSLAARTVRELGIADRVRFVGGIPQEELVRLYAEASVAVVPSLYEGFGFPAGEAMACGVPVVSTTGGALPEVVGDAGILVPTHDAGALAGAIGELFDDPERARALGDAGRRRVLERFDWSDVAGQLVELYREVIHGAHR